MLCSIASSFAIFDMRSIEKTWTTGILTKTIFNSLFELIMCLFEKEVRKNNCTKVFIGLIVIYLGNNYKNYLPVELVYPRTGDAIRNLTEMLDLEFNVQTWVTVKNIVKICQLGSRT
jgi:hypothetical protein